MTKAVLFDVDGTLIDSVDFHAQAWQDAFKDYGVDVPFEAVRAQIGKGGDQLMPVFLPREEVDRRGEEIEAHRAKLFRDRYLSRIRPFPGVRELFQRVREDGTWVVLASSSNAQDLEQYQRIAGISDLVDAVTSADDVAHSKPDPDIFAAALARVAPVRTEEAVVVGDTRFDAEAARKIGLTVVGVLSGGFPEEELRTAGCSAIYKDPEDILRNFERSPLASAWQGPARAGAELRGTGAD